MSGRAVVRLLLALVAAATLVDAGPADAQAPSLGGYQGSAGASGLHVLYAPQGLLPTSPPVDFGAPDALATISTGPSTFARASVADPGDLLANPDALLTLGSSDWQQGTIPPYPYRVEATSGVGEPTAESAPGPGLDARVSAEPSGSSAQSTMPALATPAIATVGSMSSSASTTTDGSTVSVHAHTEISNINILGLVLIDSIVTDLTATSDGGEPTLEGGTTVSGATLLDQPVTIDADGVHVAGPGSAPSDPILGGLVTPTVSSLNDVLAAAGIRLTVAGPAEQTGETSGQLASAGLRIDIAASSDELPGLNDLLDSLPPLDSPIPGAPSVEDLLVVARARHLTAMQLGRGAVSLTARPARTPVSIASNRTSSPTGSTGGTRPARTLPTSTGRATPPSARTPADVPTLMAEPASVSVGAGIGALALLALLVQPFVGDRVARIAAAVLATERADTCLREER